MKKINIGCGNDYKEGWLNTDISRAVRTDALNDIGKDFLPVTDRSAEEVYCSGVLEQIQSNNELVHAMNEMWRVLQYDGKLEVVVPNAEHSIAFQDPMDVRKFTPQTFDYFKEGTPEYKNYGRVYGFKPWKDIQIKENTKNILIVTLTK